VLAKYQFVGVDRDLAGGSNHPVIEWSSRRVPRFTWAGLRGKGGEQPYLMRIIRVNPRGALHSLMRRNKIDLAAGFDDEGNDVGVLRFKGKR
jgi:hypothetical protein